MKQVVINFSELTEEAKKKYLQFLLDNNIKVSDENQTVSLKIPKTSMPQQHRARQYSTLNDIRNCKAFTPAKNTKQIAVKTEHSVGPKFADLQEYYPMIMKQIANKELLSRPLKLTQNELMNQIEEIYQRKFVEDSNLISKNCPIPDKTFQEYVHQYLLKKQKHSKNQQIINFLSSVDLYSTKRRDVGIFQSFLRNSKQDLLTFFLFMRAVIQKQLNVPFYHPLKKQPVDLLETKLSHKQIQEIVQIVYGSQKHIGEYKKIQVNSQISICEFMNLSLVIYETQNAQAKHCGFKDNSTVSHIKEQTYEIDQDQSDLSDYDNLLKKIQSQKELQLFNTPPPLFSENKQRDQQLMPIKFEFKRIEQPNNEIQKQINIKLEGKITDFIDDMLDEIEDLSNEQKDECFQGIEQRIEDTVSALLDSIYKFDKIIWFRKLGTSPDQQGLVYIENLQKRYRQLMKQSVNDHNEIESFSIQLMQVSLLIYLFRLLIQLNRQGQNLQTIFNNIMNNQPNEELSPQFQPRTESSLAYDNEFEEPQQKPKLTFLQYDISSYHLSSQLSLNTNDDDIVKGVDAMSIQSPEPRNNLSTSLRLQVKKCSSSNPESPKDQNQNIKSSISIEQSFYNNDPNFQFMQEPQTNTTANFTFDEQQTNQRPKRKVSRTIYNVDDSPDALINAKPCHCARTHCLQLYCACFHNRKQCTPECNCNDCYNDGNHEDEMLKAIEQIKVKEQRASHHDLDSFDTRMVWGCKCKKTNCLKGYCECYIRNKKCTAHCQCKDCSNKRPMIKKRIEKNKQKRK